MLIITIYNSICQADNVPESIHNLLYEELSYRDQSNDFALSKSLSRMSQIGKLLSNPNASVNRAGLESERRRLNYVIANLKNNLHVRFYKNDEFPTGLLDRVLGLLDKNNQEYQLVDRRIKPKLNKIKYLLKQQFPSLRYYQKEAYKRAIEKGRGVIVLPTGCGKSITMAKITWELGLKTLVLTPGKEITELMLDTFIKYFGKGKVSKLNTKSDKLNDINIINVQALVKLKPELIKDIDLLITDEFHNSSAATYLEVNFSHLKNCYYRLSCSATNFRNDGSDMGLEAVFNETIYEYPLEQAFQDGFLVRPSFEIIPIRVPYFETYQKEYQSGIVENAERNKLIADIAAYHKNDNTIILVDRIEHGVHLRDMVTGSEFIHGTEKSDVRNSMLQRFRDGELKCLIGVSQILGEGVDLPIANTLILANSGKARSAVIQSIGRILRLYPGKTEALVYDFSDSGSKYLERHAEVRQEIYSIYKPK